MARMIGRTKSWLTWLAGAALALVFGGTGCSQSQPPVAKYGPPPSPPPPPSQPPGQTKPPDANPAAGLEDSPEWKRLISTWAQAEDIASGKRGLYPFTFKTVEDRTRLLTALDKCCRDVDAFAKAGLLSGAESGLLATSLTQLRKAVEREPAETEVMALCYRPAVPGANWRRTQSCAERLAQRLPLLEGLAASGKVSPPATRKVLESIETDLRALGGDLQWMEKAERKSTEKTRDAVKAAVEKLKKQMETQKP